MFNRHEFKMGYINHTDHVYHSDHTNVDYIEDDDHNIIMSPEGGTYSFCLCSRAA